MMINRTAGATRAPAPGLPVPTKPVAALAASPVATGAVTGLLRGSAQPMGAGASTMIPQVPPVPGQPPTSPMGGSGPSRMARGFTRKNTAAPPSFGASAGGSRLGMNIRSMR